MTEIINEEENQLSLILQTHYLIKQQLDLVTLVSNTS